MPPRQSEILTEAELRVMKVLWEKGSGTVQQVLDSIEERPALAYNSVLTIIRILERKGYLKHIKDGRAHVYAPVVQQQEATRSEIRRLASRFFGNSREDLVLNILEDRGIEAEELARLRTMLDRRAAGEGREMNILSSAVSLASFGLIEGWAQGAIERVVHSLPEGLLIAIFVWAVLRVLPKQNSRTRFAVWFVALMSTAGSGLWALGSRESASISSRVAEVHLAAHWATYLFIAWFAIAAIGLARLVAGLWHLRALRLSCTPVDVDRLDPAVAATMEELSAARSLTTRRVTLATSDLVRVPSALGLWSPVIALPTWALAELPAAELAIILRHEFAHLRRWDDWTNLAQKMVRAIFFFHPAVWWIESRLSVEREMACDDIVVAETDNPMGYASCLVTLLERSLAQRGWTMAQAIVHRAREASERVAQILDQNRPAGRGISKPALGLVGMFAALCVVMLPATPQFVAFDRAVDAGVPPSYSAALMRGARLRNASYHAALPPAVIPADLRSHESAKDSGHGKPAASASVVSAAVVGHIHDYASTGETPVRANEVAEVGAGNIQPASPRVVFVRETQFVTAEIPVPELTIVSLPHGPVAFFSVTMMRVTMVAPVWREMQMPPAKKI